MFEWMGENVWAVWLAAALILGASEMLTLDLTLLMLATGALGGMATAIFLPGMWGVQVLVAIAVAFLTLGFLRPTLLRKIRSAPGYRSSLQTLVGAEGLTTREITPTGGEVKVHGEAWSARAYDSSMTIPAGETIEVFELDGVTLVVHPRHQPLS